MRYGFVIDQNRCIGCHACTVACKEEHNIAARRQSAPGSSTSRKALSRHAPALRRAALQSLRRRAVHRDLPDRRAVSPTDGIVDFDNERCIGCKSCMQACPYDALYIDPTATPRPSATFDASRVEMGYKPACEVVCPTQAILSGDLDDPNSAVSKRVALEKVTVRKPEKGTKPKLFYVGVDGDLLNPTMMEPQSSTSGRKRSRRGSLRA